MAGFRLDRRSDARRGGTDVVIGAGASEGSRLYLRLIGSEYSPKMPMTGATAPARQNGFAWSRESERFNGSTIAKYTGGWRDRVLLGVWIPGDADAIPRFLESHQQADGNWWIDPHDSV